LAYYRRLALIRAGLVIKPLKTAGVGFSQAIYALSDPNQQHQTLAIAIALVMGATPRPVNERNLTFSKGAVIIMMMMMIMMMTMIHIG